MTKASYTFEMNFLMFFVLNQRLKKQPSVKLASYGNLTEPKGLSTSTPVDYMADEGSKGKSSRLKLAQQYSSNSPSPNIYAPSTVQSSSSNYPYKAYASTAAIITKETATPIMTSQPQQPLTPAESYQKIMRQDRIIFYETPSSAATKSFMSFNDNEDSVVKYEANLPQLPETSEIDLVKLKSSSSGVVDSANGKLVDIMSPTVVTTTTPPPITIRTHYVKKKDIGHGLKSSLQSSLQSNEVKNLSVIAEEVECGHSSSNSAINESVNSSEPPPPQEQAEPNADKEANSADSKNSMFDSMNDKLEKAGETEFLENEKAIMLVSADDIYDKDSLIYI